LKEVFNIRKIEMQMNEDIRDKEVRLIDTDGATLGVVPLKEAQDLATSKNMDLVKIVANVVPPVCKIMDYGKSMFEKDKKEKEAKKHQKVVGIKEVRVSVNIEDHDFEFKLKNANKFLQDGNKVKVSLRFRGREMRYTTAGKDVMAKFAQAVSEIAVLEKMPLLEGKTMMMILSPKK
jgi:translation initiation factor IF-3